MSITQKLESIQKDKNKDLDDFGDAVIEEMTNFVNEKPYKNKNSYYPPKLLAQIIPDCYTNISFNFDKFANYSEETLFYIFYSFPCDDLQKMAYKTLLSRGYGYSKLYKNFVYINDLKVVDNKKHTVFMFDPFVWCKVQREIIYDDKFLSTLEKNI